MRTKGRNEVLRKILQPLKETCVIFTLKKSTESTLRGAKFISQRGSARRNFAKRETRIFTLEKLTVCLTSPILVSYYTSSINNNHQTRSTSFKEQEEE